MAMEKGIIPGNPTFENPSPKSQSLPPLLALCLLLAANHSIPTRIVDFAGWKVKASRAAIPWPPCPIRRASVNSFGYGGSNVHVILEQAPVLPEGPRHVSSYLLDDDDFDLGSEDAEKPSLLVLSANDEAALRSNIRRLTSHLLNPRVKVDLDDLAYTLSEKRSRLFQRAFVATRNTEFDESMFTIGKKKSEPPKVGLIFTGQGAQWPQMGKDLVAYFPRARIILEELDAALQGLPQPPKWSLLSTLYYLPNPINFEPEMLMLRNR